MVKPVAETETTTKHHHDKSSTSSDPAEASVVPSRDQSDQSNQSVPNAVDGISSLSSPNEPPQHQQQQQPVKLYQSSRLKGYITLALASFINYDSAQKSGNVDANNYYLLGAVVPSTHDQRRYAVAVAVVSMIVSGGCLVAHLDRITPLETIWIMLFQQPTSAPAPAPTATTPTPSEQSGREPIPLSSPPNNNNSNNNSSGTKFEGCLAVFLTVWWSIATGFATAVGGMAGDGKGQYSLYYSYWACCLTSYWILERWGVAAGWSSLRSFISSWPNRSPAWICIMALSFLTLIWYLDLWQNHGALDRPQEDFIIQHFESIGHGQWQWLMIVVVFTFCPSVVFVLIELFRETRADGSTAAKSSTEVFLEGLCFLTLILAWTPTVMIATTARGAASLIGNSYFTTWLMSILVFEGFIWFIHDKRNETYYAIKMKEEEYRRRQRKILEKTMSIRRRYEERSLSMEGDTDLRTQPGHLATEQH